VSFLRLWWQMEAEKVINAAAEAKEAAEARAEELKRELATREDPAAVEALRRQVVSLASLVDSSMEAEGWAAGNGAGKPSQGADKSTVQSWLQVVCLCRPCPSNYYGLRPFLPGSACMSSCEF
jgi:hypothetical protein